MTHCSNIYCRYPSCIVLIPLHMSINLFILWNVRFNTNCFYLVCIFMFYMLWVFCESMLPMQQLWVTLSASVTTACLCQLHVSPVWQPGWMRRGPPERTTCRNSCTLPAQTCPTGTDDPGSSRARNRSIFKREESQRLTHAAAWGKKISQIHLQTLQT